MDNRDSKVRQESNNERARKDMAEFKAKQAKINEKILVANAKNDREKNSIKTSQLQTKSREDKNKVQNNIKKDKNKEENLKVNTMRREGHREEGRKLEKTHNTKIEKTKIEKTKEGKNKANDIDKKLQAEEIAKKRLEKRARIDERARKEAKEKLVVSVEKEQKEQKRISNSRKIDRQSQRESTLKNKGKSDKKVSFRNEEVKVEKDTKGYNKVTDIKEVKKVALENEKKRRKEARDEYIRHRIEQLKTTKAKILIASFVFVITFLVFISVTIINDIEIDEGKHYTEEQIKSFVMKSVFDYNSVYLFLKYRYSEHDAIPFVEYIDVSWVNKNAVKIKVYDKNIIGCTNFMNEYVYFDKDGFVVETSTKREHDIPYITGIEFEALTLNSKIKVADEDIFDVILTVTQQISKYQLEIKEINFDKDYNLTLHSGDVTVLLGRQLTYDEQLAKLQSMLREAKKENLSGVLHMEKYKEGQDRIIFDKNN